MRRLLITNALPYANGSIHLGHMVEAIQTDIFARAMRMKGHEVLYVSGDDTHGTPIELSARNLGISPEALIRKTYEEHAATFARYDISFDLYHMTHNEENRLLAEHFFAKLREKGHIREETVKQLYSESLERFLPDRYVRGTCPKCGQADQYGDVCEHCNAKYDATELIDPKCVIDGGTPVIRESEHLFMSFAELSAWLRDFAASDALDDEVRNFVNAWLDEGLQNWNISRDAPYFGFEIPGYPGKYFYVWMDAPIGYVAATQACCEAGGTDYRRYWNDEACEIWHFIGKDIIYFHTLFWPAMLKAADFNVPAKVKVHGFLTVNGKKMSKSRGTFIMADDYVKVLPAAYLRYYFAAKLSGSVEDIDLNIDDFYFRVRSGLIDNLGNLHNRSFAFAETKLGGKLCDFSDDADCAALVASVRAKIDEALGAYETADTAAVLRLLTEAGDIANGFYQSQQPWSYLKGDAADPGKARRIVGACIEAVRLIAIAISPIVPDFSQKIFAQLGYETQVCADLDKAVGSGTEVRAVEKTYLRPEKETFDALLRISESKEAEKVEKTGESQSTEGSAPENVRPETEVRAIKENIDFAQFEAMDIRVGKVLQSERVPKSNKLLKNLVEIGHPDGPVQIVSGIAKHYDPEQMVGKHVLVLANLAPRKIFGIESRGMILAASNEHVLELPSVNLAVPGSHVS